MSLKTTIESEIKKSMLAKDKVRLTALRAIKSLILLAETEKGGSTEISTDVEMQLFDLMVKWSNVFQNVIDDRVFRSELKLATITKDSFIDVQFNEPSVVQTVSEREDSSIKLIEAGLKSRKEAIMDLRGVSEDKAEEIIREIDELDALDGRTALQNLPVNPQAIVDQEEADVEDGSAEDNEVENESED